MHTVAFTVPVCIYLQIDLLNMFISFAPGAGELGWFGFGT